MSCHGLYMWAKKPKAVFGILTNLLFYKMCQNDKIYHLLKS